jgi:parvulin-like peptidyl-prolyl isomerase
MAALKKDMLNSLIERELLFQQSQKEGIQVTDQKVDDQVETVKKRFEQVKASHILIKVDAKADEAKKTEARKKIKDVQQKLKDGGDFAALAKEYSEGPSNVKGGDLGYFGRGQMAKPFEDAAFALKLNEISDVVETRFGYHLIKVYDKKSEYKNILSKMNLTEDEVKMQIKRGLSINELIDQQIISKIAVTDEEGKAYYDENSQQFKQPEQIKASQILIKVDAKADEAKKTEARKKIEEVQQKLKNDGDFADLAKEYSEGPSSSKGGDLGYIRRGQMAYLKPFGDAAFALKPNEVSDIVETRVGYHLIKVYDIKPERIPSYTELKDNINQRIKQEKIEKKAGQYLDKLKKEAKIERFI